MTAKYTAISGDLMVEVPGASCRVQDVGVESGD